MSAEGCYEHPKSPTLKCVKKKKNVRKKKTKEKKKQKTKKKFK